jgi:hypothetical protein
VQNTIHGRGHAPELRQCHEPLRHVANRLEHGWRLAPCFRGTTPSLYDDVVDDFLPLSKRSIYHQRPQRRHDGRQRLREIDRISPPAVPRICAQHCQRTNDSVLEIRTP